MTMKKLLFVPTILVAGALALAGCSATADPGPSKNVGKPVPSASESYDPEAFKEAMDKVVETAEAVVEQAKDAEKRSE